MAIPNDPTNLGRALLLLQKEKLITLKEGKGLLPTALDITENPRHLQIMELEGAQLPRVLDDPKVDVADYQHHLHSADQAFSGARQRIY